MYKCINLRFLDLGTVWRSVISFTPLLLYPWGRAPGRYWIRGWVGPQNWSKRYGEVKILDPTGTLNFDPTVIQPVASSYIDWATAAFVFLRKGKYLFSFHRFRVKTEILMKLRNAYKSWWPPLWSSGQSSWIQIQGSRFRFPGTTKKK
jgi:hypothetical protein